MKPAAQIQAVIELLDAIKLTFDKRDRRPADAIIASYFKSRRYIGSKDKGVIAELVYNTLRHKAALEWWLVRSGLQLTGRSWAIAALVLIKEYSPGHLEQFFDEEEHSPTELTKEEAQSIRQFYRQPLVHPDMPEDVKLNIPHWMLASFREQFGDNLSSEMQALEKEAPVDLRMNTIKIVKREVVINELRREKFDPEPTQFSPIGIRLRKRGAIFASPTFKRGWFEVQDEGSQLVALIADAKPGQRVIDFCAGAGGKTLAIAASMQNKGKILAFDNAPKRLDQIKVRLRRAGVDTVEIHVIESEQDKFLKRHADSADIVLVDAPCSGTGTWRRNPDLKWRTFSEDIEELLDIQRRILASAAKLVKPGGRLVYATCSLLKNENDQQVEKFLADNPKFRVVTMENLWNNIPSLKDRYSGNYLTLTPFRDRTDGFFAAVLERSKPA